MAERLRIEGECKMGEDAGGRRRQRGGNESTMGDRVADLVRRVGLQPAVKADGTGGYDVEAARGALEQASEQLLESVRAANANGTQQSELVRRFELLAELQQLKTEMGEEALSRRVRALTSVQEALSRLRGVESVEHMLNKATLELCRSCGFDRAILSRVEGSNLVAASMHFEGHDEEAQRIMRVWNQDPPELNHLLLETEMLRRRAPALVLDPTNDPRAHKRLIEETGTPCYVAAPIMPEGRVIGFLHADYVYSGLAVD